MNGVQVVVGSNPTGPTNKIRPFEWSGPAKTEDASSVVAGRACGSIPVWCPPQPRLADLYSPHDCPGSADRPARPRVTQRKILAINI
jgi:hypothetical protein